jgi:hypothetical protein
MTFRAVALLAAVGILLSGSAFAQDPPSPFQGKPQPARGIHVDDPGQWNGTTPKVLHEPDDNDPDERIRLGTVAAAPGVSVDVETIDNRVNFPYFFELTRAGGKPGAGATMLRLPVMALGDTEWYFPGNGFVYVSSPQWGLCGPRTTRKFALNGHAFVEVPQPLVYLGAMSRVEKTTPLFDTPEGHKVVATLTAGTQVLVLAMQYAAQPQRAGPLLVKTPLGLVGWHRPDVGQVPDDGQIDLYLCN